MVSSSGGNRTYREAVLDMFVFQALSEVREQTEKWMKEYNEESTWVSGPHDTQRISANPRPEISTDDRS